MTPRARQLVARKVPRVAAINATRTDEENCSERMKVGVVAGLDVGGFMAACVVGGDGERDTYSRCGTRAVGWSR